MQKYALITTIDWIITAKKVKIKRKFKSCVDYFAVAVGVKELYTTNKKLLQEGIRYAVWRTTIRGVFNRL